MPSEPDGAYRSGGRVEAPPPGLRRTLGPVSTLLISVGAMVGSGIFATPHDVAVLVGSVTVTLGLWIVGGVLALLGALSFVELAAAVPETGGLYVWLRRAFGPFAGFAFGWAMLAVLVPSAMGFFAQVCAEHLAPLLHVPARPVAIAVIATLVGLNVLGVRPGAAAQDAATVLKYAGVLLLAVAGVFVAARVHLSALPVVPPNPGATTLIAALVPVLWAYDGWIDVASIAGEVRDPARQIPRSITLGTVLVTALYLLANVAYLRVLGPAALAASATPAVDGARQVAGERGAVVVSLLVAVATFGGCAVSLLTGSRVVYAVARDGLFFAAFARISKRTGAPDLAVAVCGALAIAYLASPLGRLGEIFVVGAWPFYGLGALGTIALRRREPDLARPVRTPGYPVPQLVFAAASVAIVVGYALRRPVESAESLGVIVVGLPLYALARRRR